MSTSSAPAATAYFTSASLTSRLVRRLGNAVATLATCTPLPLSSATATWARSGYTQTAATIGAVGSAGSGRLALAHSARTLPGVSWPSSVVRSIIEIAASRAHCLAVVLMDLLASMAARASAPTRSTPGSPCRNRRSEASHRAMLCVSAGALICDSLRRGHQSPFLPTVATSGAASLTHGRNQRGGEVNRRWRDRDQDHYPERAVGRRGVRLAVAARHPQRRRAHARAVHGHRDWPAGPGHRERLAVGPRRRHAALRPGQAQPGAARGAARAGGPSARGPSARGPSAGRPRAGRQGAGAQ